jgi:hypothetical protein
MGAPSHRVPTAGLCQPLAQRGYQTTPPPSGRRNVRPLWSSTRHTRGMPPGARLRPVHWWSCVVSGWMASQQKIIRTLLDVAGRTYASKAGIRLANTPSPLYRLLVLSVLPSTRIKAGGYRRGRGQGTGQSRIHHTPCHAGSELAAAGRRTRQGALRPLRREHRHRTRCGPNCAPTSTAKPSTARRRIGLPAGPGRLAELVGEEDLSRLAAGLVRVSLDRRLAGDVRDA